jgi:hypothetical protein
MIMPNELQASAILAAFKITLPKDLVLLNRERMRGVGDLRSVKDGVSFQDEPTALSLLLSISKIQIHKEHNHGKPTR